jgi:hypothetical protein
MGIEIDKHLLPMKGHYFLFNAGEFFSVRREFFFSSSLRQVQRLTMNVGAFSFKELLRWCRTFP